MNKHKAALNKARESTVKSSRDWQQRDRGVLTCNLETLQKFQEVQEHTKRHFKETTEIQRKSIVMPREQNWKNRTNRG